jgi:hydroxyacylglutathione hydrolase
MVAKASDSEKKTAAATESEAATEAATEEAKPKRGRRFQRPPQSTEEIARAYFEAIDARDMERATSLWAEGGIDSIAAIGDLRAPHEIKDFFNGLFEAVPDWRLEVIDVVAGERHAAVHWRNSGTFCGAPFMGVEPTGARLQLQGVDLLTIEDGKIQRNDAYYDGATFARQIGLLPERDSTAERRMTAAFNLRTRIATRLFAPSKELVAEGVWVVRAGFPVKSMNVYLIEDDGGVTIFDAGIKAMTKGIASAVATMGGAKRVVLGHGHGDHRGAAPGLGLPVYCHPDEVADAESDGGEHYFDYSKLQRWFARTMMPRLIHSWDGGPVKIEGTVSEGDDIAGFKVVHLPGHAPGLIGLWRGSDRLALVSDTLYTLDPETGRHGHPRVPHVAFNKDTEQARASILKLAAMEPAAVWPGHADPVTGDVKSQLEKAARET